MTKEQTPQTPIITSVDIPGFSDPVSGDLSRNPQAPAEFDQIIGGNRLSQSVVLGTEGGSLVSASQYGIPETKAVYGEDGGELGIYPVEIKGVISFGASDDKEGTQEKTMLVTRSGNEWSLIAVEPNPYPTDAKYLMKSSLQLRLGESYTFGRGAQSTNPRQNEGVIPASALWGAKESYGDTISTKHVRVGMDEQGGVVVTDLGSVNGTRVRGLANEGTTVSGEQATVADRGPVVGSRVGQGIANIGALPPQPKQEDAPKVLAPKDYIDKITEGLLEEDKLNLWRLASARSRMADAQRSGDGAESTRSGQDMGQAQQALSPEARELASRVADAYQRLWAD